MHARPLMCLICGGVVLIGTAARADQRTVAPPPQTYLVGAAVRDITPDYPIRLSGFGSRRTESEGVTLPIYARALAIGSDADGPAVLIAVDTPGVSDALVSELARRLQPLGIRRERLAVTATHTHTAPMLTGVCPTLFGTPIPTEHQANIDRYTREFTDDAGEGRPRRAGRPQAGPADLGHRQGRASPSTAGRRRAGRSRPAAARRPRHRTASSARSGSTTPATPSRCRTTRSAATGPATPQQAIEDDHPGAVALVSVGCGADSNPSSGVTGDKVEIASRQGLSVGREVKRLLGGYLCPGDRARSPSASRTVELPLADLPSKEEWEKRHNRKDAVGHHAQRPAGAAGARREAANEDRLSASQTWAFGDSLAMVFLPGEVVVDYALRLKSELDGRRLWLNAYSNDAPCYIPSERILKEGGYEGGGAMIYYDMPVPFAAAWSSGSSTPSCACCLRATSRSRKTPSPAASWTRPNPTRSGKQSWRPPRPSTRAR